MKSKLALIKLTLPSLFLALGSISCSQDNSSSSDIKTPVTLPSPPALVGEEKSLNFSGNATMSIDSWALSDQLVFKDLGAFTNLIVEAQCIKNEDQTFKSLIKSPLKKNFFLFELVPAEALTLDFDKSKVSCTWHFKALTNNRDAHRFSLQNIHLTEIKRPQVSISSPIISHEEIPQTQILFNTIEQKEVALSCADQSVRSRFDSSSLRTLSDFQIHDFKTDEMTSVLSPCRVITLEKNGNISGASNLFHLSLSSNSVALTSQIQYERYGITPPNSTGAISDKMAIAIFLTNTGYPLLPFSVTNSDQTDIWVKFPYSLQSKTRSVATNDHSYDGYSKLFCHQFNSDVLKLAVPNQLERQINGGEIFIRVPAQTTVSLSYNLIDPIRPGAYPNTITPIISQVYQPIVMSLLYVENKDLSSSKVYSEQKIEITQPLILSYGTRETTRIEPCTL